jgi:hypothetical protein
LIGDLSYRLVECGFLLQQVTSEANYVSYYIVIEYVCAPGAHYLLDELHLDIRHSTVKPDRLDWVRGGNYTANQLTGG